MNSRIGRLLTIVLLILVSLIIILGIIDTNEITIRKVVNDNSEFLSECITNKSYDRIYEIKGIKKITNYSVGKNKIFIDFFWKGVGIAPSGIYYGFYYTSDDKPSGFQNGSEKLEKDKDSWKWNQINGDNYYITKRIKANWYYYEAGF